MGNELIVIEVDAVYADDRGKALLSDLAGFVRSHPAFATGNVRVARIHGFIERSEA